MNQELTDFFLSKNLVINSVISHGSFGEVFQVYSTQYKTIFALKKIPLNKFNQDEVECLKAIDDSRIVSLYDYYIYEGNAYMLMEFCPNDLEKLVQNSCKFNEHELQKLTYDVVMAIKSCHDRNIAHCDIKPANFMFDIYGRLKIGDFGFSIFCDPSKTIKNYKGTKLFMSPEVINKQSHDPFKADIWSLGVTLYYIATSSLPFYSRDSVSLFDKICHGVFLDEVIENPNLRAIIKACLDIDPLKRPLTSDILKMTFFRTMAYHSHANIRCKDGILTHDKIIARSKVTKSLVSQHNFKVKRRSLGNSERMSMFPNIIVPSFS